MLKVFEDTQLAAVLFTMTKHLVEATYGEKDLSGVVSRVGTLVVGM